MFSYFSFLWFIKTTKASLFWVYLWQLKEYHVGRFIDHFRTDKGQSIFLNPLLWVKVVLLFSFFQFPVLLLFVLFFIYLGEGIKVLVDIYRKRVILPVLTKKTMFLISVVLLLEVLFLGVLHFYNLDILSVLFWLLLVDVLLPLIVSLVVLLLQPIAVFGRNQIIKKARLKREKFSNLLVIGITGSYGKTSTKEILADILSERFKVLKTKDHQNSEMGISQCILNELGSEHQVFVVEMGAYNKGGIKLLASIVKPKIGVITGVNEQHMATFGSQENIVKAKYELIESLPADGVAFFNGKNKYCLDMYQKTKIKKFLFGQDVKDASQENIAGAMAIAQELGMSQEEIAIGAKRVESRIPGVEAKEGIIGLKILDATYSANPNGVMFHLDCLKSLPGRKIIVMPCLIELGAASVEVHKRIGEKIGEVCDLAIITTKDRFPEIKKGAPDALFIDNPKEMFNKIKSFAKEGDVVLLESRVPVQLIQMLTGIK